MLLLQDVLAKNQISSDLLLADPPKKYRAILERLDRKKKKVEEEIRLKEEEKKNKELNEKSQT